MKVPANREEALRLAREAWAASPVPRLAALVDRLSKELGARRAPLGTRPSLQAAWLARAKLRDDADVPLLLAAVRSGSADAIVARLEVLATFPPDPRIESFLLASVEAPLLPGKAGRRVASAVFRLLARSVDPQVTETLRRWCDGEPGFVTARLRSLSAGVLREFVALVEELEARPRRDVKLSAARAEWCDAVERSLQTKVAAVDGETLLARVWADPADDAPRHLYADWLQEQGDERGEFIALQLERHAAGAGPGKRERALEKKWGRTWLGEAQEIILKRDLVYRRGFLAECAVVIKRREQDRLIGHPVFATVERFDCAGAMVGIEALFQHPACRALTEVVGYGDEVSKLVRPLKRLGLRFPGVDLPTLARQQPALEALRLDGGPHQLEALVAFARAHPTLQRLIVNGTPVPF